ncbi:MAG: hypothetical protein U1B83_10380, partial [Candidatus Cloacimonadaceae bacterium]|nr:hypothetical protein [Candidatus Cloacimonadaceae bacterium]
MKKVACLIAILALFAGLYANPLVPRAVARVWFDAQGDFNVLFGDEDSGFIDIPSLTFSTSSGTWGLPAGFTPPSALPYAINFSQTIPGFSINPTEDHFIVHTAYPDEEVYWSPQSGLNVNLHPLGQDQSAVQVRMHTMDWEGGTSINVWAKDNGLNGGFYPAYSCTLNVHVSYSDGSPVPNHPFWISYAAYISDMLPALHTNAAGNFQAIDYACRTRILVKDPLTNLAVLNEIIYPEPGQSYQLNAVISGTASHDPLMPTPSGILEVFPNVLGPASSGRITLKYAGGNAFSQPMDIRLYDLRGRLLEQ